MDDDTTVQGELLYLRARVRQIEQTLTEIYADIEGTGGIMARLRKLEKENGAALVVACEIRDRLQRLEAGSGKMKEEEAP